MFGMRISVIYVDNLSFNKTFIVDITILLLLY